MNNEESVKVFDDVGGFGRPAPHLDVKKTADEAPLLHRDVRFPVSTSNDEGDLTP